MSQTGTKTAKDKSVRFEEDDVGTHLSIEQAGAIDRAEMLRMQTNKL